MESGALARGMVLTRAGWDFGLGVVIVGVVHESSSLLILHYYTLVPAFNQTRTLRYHLPNTAVDNGSYDAQKINIALSYQNRSTPPPPLLDPGE
jgi:hypothetical protein